MAGSPAQILMQGCQLAQEHIDSLRAVAPVEIVFMGGNHDRHSSLMLMMYLDAYYKHADDVNVIVSPHIRQYVNYGNNLMGFTHGDGKVMNKLHSLMAHEARRLGSTQNHMWSTDTCIISRWSSGAVVRSYSCQVWPERTGIMQGMVILWREPVCVLT